MVMNLDFAETFLDIAGLAGSRRHAGPEPRARFSQARTPADWRKSVYYHYYEFPQPHHVHPHNGVRTDRYKLIHFYTIDAWELFDLEKDPHELKSVYDDPAYAPIVADLKKELKRLMEQYKDDGTTVVKFENPQSADAEGEGQGKRQGKRELISRATSDVEASYRIPVRRTEATRTGHAAQPPRLGCANKMLKSRLHCRESCRTATPK